MRSHTEWPFKKYDRLNYGGNIIIQKDFAWDFVGRQRILEFDVIEGELKGKSVKIPLATCLAYVDGYKLEAEQ